MKITALASGSSGNCICVSDGENSFLIDAGISKKKIEEGLATIGVLPEKLKGILITHEHIDHIRGLGVFLRKYDIPVYGTEETLESVTECSSLGKINTELFQSISPDKEFDVAGFGIRPLRISHDAVNPVAYRFEKNDKSGAVITDLGLYNDYIVDNLKGMDAILIEANYDLNMLQTGVYPYKTKQRIWGERGHLSNEMSGRLIGKIISEKLKYVTLGHLSKENNYPELAYEAVRNEVNASQNNFDVNKINLTVARRDIPSDTIEV